MPVDTASNGLNIYRLESIEVAEITLKNVLAKVGGATDCVGLALLNRFIVVVDATGNVTLSPNDFNAFHDHSFNDGTLGEYRMNTNGVREMFLKKVLSGSAAERAGLQAGDQLLEILNDSGENVIDIDNELGHLTGLSLLVPRTKPLQIEFLRDGKKARVELEPDMAVPKE